MVGGDHISMFSDLLVVTFGHRNGLTFCHILIYELSTKGYTLILPNDAQLDFRKEGKIKVNVDGFCIFYLNWQAFLDQFPKNQQHQMKIKTATA